MPQVIQSNHMVLICLAKVDANAIILQMVESAHMVLICLAKAKVRFILLLLMLCVKCARASYLTLTLQVQMNEDQMIEVDHTFGKGKAYVVLANKEVQKAQRQGLLLDLKF